MPELAALTDEGIEVKTYVANSAVLLDGVDTWLDVSREVGDLAHVLASLRDLRNTVAMLCDTAERCWDNEALLRDLKPRLVATEDGEPLDGPSVLERVQEVFRLSGSNARVTALRDVLGVRELDEYCQEEALGYAVQITGAS
jgi:hypothetical protein